MIFKILKAYFPMLVVFFGSTASLSKPPKSSLTSKTSWPLVKANIKWDAQIESKVAKLLSQMTLEQKIGQMVQVSIESFSAEKMRRFHFGSVLNGGGSWPGKNKYAHKSDWVKFADSIWLSAMDSASLRIPLLWGIDAVHGHNNKIGATIFPHNIGLGATRDTLLIKKIGEITALETAATGIDWTFAPTLAVVRDDRWGRSYESYSENPETVAACGSALVRGLQGNFSPFHILATAKHFIGDGGTLHGDDRGDNRSREEDLRNIHGAGYFSALKAGVQTVMVSFSSWQGSSMHGHKYLLSDVLKGQMGFDGFIISDWNGINEVKGCRSGNCPQAVNAGIDMFMIPFENDWRAFIEGLLAQVKKGEVPIERINDAVTRILRVKMRAGLFNKPIPSKRPAVLEVDSLGRKSHREIAREAVRKSLVLLKNNNNMLPLSPKSRVLVAGAGADNLAMQTGGWTITWQGTGNTNEDYRGATSILEGIKQSASSVDFDVTGEKADSSLHDVAVVVIGEQPYAEFKGDIEGSRTLEHSKFVPEDYKVLQTISKAGVPIVTVFLSGRPLYVNRELNLSEAFVAAWLPGSEGMAVADVLFKDKGENIRFDFQGKLSFSWPASPCQTDVNLGESLYSPLFPFDFGLTYKNRNRRSPGLPEETNEGYGCTGLTMDQLKKESRLPVYPGNQDDNGMPWMGDPSNWQGISGEDGATLPNLKVKRAANASGASGTAQHLIFSGEAYWAWIWNTIDGIPYFISDYVLAFDVKLNAKPQGTMEVRIVCEYPCLDGVDITDKIKGIPLKTWTEIRLPLKRFESADFMKISSPFQINTTGNIDVTIANIRWEPE